MAAKIVWSPAAIEDLQSIVWYVAERSRKRARILGLALIAKVELLADHPSLGRIVPEIEDPTVREISHGTYRIVYRTDDSILVEVVRIWHSARGTPTLP